MITVLMGMFNTKEEELRASIESILNQTYKNFEFLIINDASTDNSKAIVESYKDNRIRLIDNEKNLGLEKTLNRGLMLAKNEFIVRMDTDDIAYPERLEKQLKFAMNHPEYSIIGTRAEIFDENGIIGTSKKYGPINKEDFIFGAPFMHPTILLRKSDVLKCGGYPLYKRCEDYAMEMNLYSNGYKGYIMNDILMKYRMTQAGFKKKKYKYRIIESKVKYVYFKKLGIKWYKYIYIIKPLIVGLLPKKILSKIFFKRIRGNINE